MEADASFVIPLFQPIPVFAFILGWAFLQETLSVNQLFGGLLIIGGAILISLNLSLKRVSIKQRMLWLMSAASLLFAMYSLLFKMGGQGRDFWTASFWFYIGFGIGGMLFLLHKPFREQFLQTFRNNRRMVSSLNATNEVLNICGVLLATLAFRLAPLALVWAVVGTQPFFALIIGVLLTLVFPHIIKEQISRRHILQKGSAITVIFVGSALVNHRGDTSSSQRLGGTQARRILPLARAGRILSSWITRERPSYTK